MQRFPAATVPHPHALLNHTLLIQVAETWPLKRVQHNEDHCVQYLPFLIDMFSEPSRRQSGVQSKASSDALRSFFERIASILIAMASNLRAMASNVEAMASDLTGKITLTRLLEPKGQKDHPCFLNAHRNDFQSTPKLVHFSTHFHATFIHLSKVLETSLPWSRALLLIFAQFALLLHSRFPKSRN